MIIIDAPDEDWGETADWLSFLEDMRGAMDTASSIDDAIEIQNYITTAQRVLQARGVEVPKD